MKIYRHRQSVCEVCGAPFSASTQVTGEVRKAPRPGDFTLCLECAQPYRYTEDLTVKALTRQEIEELRREHPLSVKDLEETIAKLEAFNRERKHGD
jgi:hypothetical protein